MKRLVITAVCMLSLLIVGTAAFAMLPGKTDARLPSADTQFMLTTNIDEYESPKIVGSISYIQPASNYYSASAENIVVPR